MEAISDQGGRPDAASNAGAVHGDRLVPDGTDGGRRHDEGQMLDLGRVEEVC